MPFVEAYLPLLLVKLVGIRVIALSKFCLGWKKKMATVLKTTKVITQDQPTHAKITLEVEKQW